MDRTPAVLLATLALVAALAGTASARPFGSKTQYIVTTDAHLDFERATTRVEGADDLTRTEWSFVLSGDYTRFRNVSFGAVVGFEGNLVGKDDAEKGFLFGGRVGYVVPLGETAALWPRLGLTFGNTTFQSATDEYTVSSTRLTASLPLMFNPSPQVLVGVAPTFEHDLRATTGDATPVPKVTGYGIHLMLGFWFE
jgi:hypothetical protein